MEVKYKIWDKEQKCWVHDVHVDIHMDGIINDPCQENKVMNDLYITLLWIGLKDRNGRNIFEGDILLCYGDNYNGVVEWNDADKHIEGVGFCIHEYYPNPKNDRYHTLTAYTTKLEVIGNIFENPELKNKWGINGKPTGI
jgi:uncharacterized phage protein (TIGR01671 family)